MRFALVLAVCAAALCVASAKSNPADVFVKSVADEAAIVDEAAPAAEKLVQTETTTGTKAGTGYFNFGYSFSGAWEEFSSSCYYAIIGVFMCCIAFPCLYWNEGRNVTRQKTLNAAEDEAIVLSTGHQSADNFVDAAYQPKDENTDKLINFIGKPACTSASQKDWQLGIEAKTGDNVWKIERSVRAFLWQTQSHTEQRNTGRRDSEGREITETITIIDEPELGWETVYEGRGVSNPQLPDRPKHGKSHYDNAHPFGIGTGSFQTGWVKVGPYELTMGMLSSEMRSVSEALQPDLEALKAFVGSESATADITVDPEAIAAAEALTAKRAQLTDLEAQLNAAKGANDFAKCGELDNQIKDLKKELGIDDETSKDDPDETTGLLSGDEASGERGNNCPGPLPPQAKAYVQDKQDEVTVEGNCVCVGDTSKKDYKATEPAYMITWTAYKLPTTPDGKVFDHTALAKQIKTKTGAWAIVSFLNEDIAQFHLDSCCAYVCCLGYYVVADSGPDAPEPKGLGCIACIDGCCCPNASSDEGRDGDVEEGHSMADNSRTVEKFAEGQKTVSEIIHGMADANAEKTKLYRYAGFFIMFLGFQLVMDPIPTVFHFIPFIGTAVGFILSIAVFIVALALGCFGSITTISIAWVRYRPCIGIPAIILITVIAVGICFLPPISTWA
jgi:hypothetical protein